MALRIGMHTGVQDVSYPDLRKLWQIADSNGFYWVSVWDHFYENPTQDGKSPCFEATTTMAAIAAETENVRIGCLVMAIGYRNPALLAKATVTIDHISNGRVEMGIGGGWYEMEFLAYGYPYPPIKTPARSARRGCPNHPLHAPTTSPQPSRASTTPSITPTSSPAPSRPLPGSGSAAWARSAPCALPPSTPTAGTPPTSLPRCSPPSPRSSTGNGARKNAGIPASITRSVNLGFYMGTDEADARKKHDDIESAWGDDPHLQTWVACSSVRPLRSGTASGNTWTSASPT